MRNMNCRNVRREIEGAEPSQLLSGSAKAHLASCSACATLAREQSSLHTIVSSLGTVEAPGDFEFRLRARLAGERRGSSEPYALRNFSFGLRAGAVATVLLLIGSAFVFVSLKMQRVAPAAKGGQPLAANPGTSAAGSGSASVGTKAVATSPVPGSQMNPSAIADSGQKSIDREPQKRQRIRNEFAAFKGSNPAGNREIGQTQARVLTPDSEEIGTYPTAAFQINASNQSLKVSVDDGRGAYRTISLPTVSFGSERALSQSASPLVSAARGVW